jgi:hypothetical protein
MAYIYLAVERRKAGAYMARNELVGALVVEQIATLPRQIVRLRMFDKVADKLFAPDEIGEIEYAVASCRHLGCDQLGPLIQGTGGVRKMRWATTNNKGKSHGARVWYYYGGDHMPIFLMAAYPKSKKENLSPAEKKEIRKLVRLIDNEWDKYREE